MFLPESFYSVGYQLIDRCNRMIERNLKDAGTIVDTKFVYDATSRKISVHVGADSEVTLSSDLASIMGISPREMTFREERKHKGRSEWTRKEDSIVYTSKVRRLYQWAILRLPFYAWSMLLEISKTQFTDCIRRHGTSQSQSKSLAPWK